MSSRSTRGTSTTASPSHHPAMDYCCSVCDRLLFVKTDDPVAPVTPWRCLACDQSFTVKSSVKRHVAKAHVAGGLALVCRECGICSRSKLEYTELNSETADAVAEMEEDGMDDGVEEGMEEGMEEGVEEASVESELGNVDANVETRQPEEEEEEEKSSEEKKSGQFYIWDCHFSAKEKGKKMFRI